MLVGKLVNVGGGRRSGRNVRFGVRCWCIILFDIVCFNVIKL